MTPTARIENAVTRLAAVALLATLLAMVGLPTWRTIAALGQRMTRLSTIATGDGR